MSTETDATPKIATLGEWKKAKVHTVRLPSGPYIGMQIPDLAMLIEAGEIPQNLLDAALAVVGGDEQKQTVTKEFILQEREFTNRLVLAAVVQPKLTERDVDDLPLPDKAMIVAIATRQIDFDIEGNHIGGLHTSDKFRKFRGLDQFDTDLEDV